MSIFTKAATTALTGLAIFGFASAAFAHHVPQQPFVESESVGLLNTVQATGHEVFVDGGMCNQGNGILGYATTSGELVICAKNHGNDMDELADTIRHEALHLVQFCKGRRNGATAALLVPQHAQGNLDYAINHLHMPEGQYEARQHYAEGEARVLAYSLDEHEVANLLIEECGIK